MIDFIFILFVILYFIYMGTFVVFKTSLFFLLASIPLFNLKNYQYIKVSRDFAKVIYLWFSYLLFSFVISIINGFELPNFKTFFNIYFLIPLSLTTAQLISNRFTLLRIYKTLILITSLILLMNYSLFFLDYYGLRDNFIIGKIFTDDSFGALVNIDGGLRFRSENVVALTYLIPLIYIYFFVSYKKFSRPFQNILKINIFVGFIIVLLSGRRSLQYASILALFFFSRTNIS